MRPATARPPVTGGARCPLPGPRGELSAFLIDRLVGPPGDHLAAAPEPDDDPLTGGAAALSLSLLYELHYRGLEDVDNACEWQPGLLALRGRLEAAFLARLREEVEPIPEVGDIVGFLQSLFADDEQPSVAGKRRPARVAPPDRGGARLHP